MLARTLRWQRVAVAVAVAGSAVVFYKSEGDIYGVTKATVVALAAVACLAIAAGRAIREREVVLPRLWCAAAAGAFAVALGITTITSTTPLQSLVGEYSQFAGFLGYLAGVILFFTVVRAFDERTLPVLVLTVVGAGAVVTLYGLLQWADIDPWHLTSAHNVVSTMGNTNFLAGWIGIAFPLCVVVAIAPLPVAWRVLAGATAVGIVPLAVATESFQGPATVGAAALALVVLLLLTGVVPVPRVLRGRRGIAAVLVLVVLAAPVAVKVLGDGVDQGLLERRHFWHVALEVFEDHPVVGAGPDTFHNQFLSRRPAAHAAIPYSKNGGAAHDVPLDLLAGGGILLGGTYLAFVGLVGWRLIVAVRRRTATPWLLSGIGAAWFGYQVQSFVSIDKPQLLLLHWVLAGAVVVLSGPFESRSLALPGRPVRRSAEAPVSTVVGIGVVSVLALTAGWFATRPLRADLAAVAGRRAIAHQDGDAAERDLKKARRLAPWEATYTYDLVRLYTLASQADGVQPEAATRYQGLALAAAEDGARLEPGDSSYDLVVAQVAESQGNRDLANTWFDTALRKDPYGVDILLPAMATAGRGGDRARVERLVDRVLAVSRSRADIWVGVGYARHAIGDDAGARTAYDKALALEPGNAAAEQGLQELGK